MQSFAKDLSRVRIRRQSGSVATLGALWLMVAVICLATIDIGNVFWQKRELQKIADLAALAGASGPLASSCNSDKSASTYLNASTNGLLAGDFFEPTIGKWVASNAGNTNQGFETVDANAKEANACKVTLRRNVPVFFVIASLDGSARTVKAVAIARQSARMAKITARTTLLSLNTDDSILGPVLKGLLGTTVNVNAIGWKGLSNINLDLLGYLNILSTKLGVRVGSYTDLLGVDTNVGILLETMIEVVQQKSTASAQVAVLRQILAAVKVNPVSVKLSQLLNLGTGLNDSALNTDVNLLDLVSSAILLANSKNAANVDLGLSLGIANVKLKLKVIEPPQWALGDPSVDVIQARTAQIRLNTEANLNVIGLAEVDLNLKLDVASGTAKVVGYSCAPKKYLDVDVNSGLLSVSTEGSAVKLVFGLIQIPLNINLPFEKNFPSQNFEDPPSTREEPKWKNLNMNFSIASALVNGISDALLGKNVLSATVKAILEPVKLLLDGILGALITALGIDLSQVDVGAQMNCGFRAELVY